MMRPVLKFTNHLRILGALGLLTASAVLFTAPFLGAYLGFKLATMTLAALSVATSLYLLFESLLFRFMAGFDTELSACYAVDDFLFRAGLRRRAQKVRKMEERFAGTRKIIIKWCILMTLMLVALMLEALFPNTWSTHV